MIQICNRFAAFLYGVEHPRIYATQRLSGQDNCERWATLVSPFKGAKWLYSWQSLNRHHSFFATTEAVQKFTTSTHKRIPEPMPRHAPLPDA
jgi:hypothetical protein